MLLCVTPNPSIERTWVIPNLCLGEVFRVQDQVVLASGKGVNVARTAKILGADVFCVGFLAGFCGRYLEKLAEQEGLRGEWVWVQGETRHAIALVNPLNEEDATLISETGPTIKLSDWGRLRTAVLNHLNQAEMVCFSGSFPIGTSFEQFHDLIHDIQDAGVPVWVDSEREGLEMALKAKIMGIKVNTREASAVVGFPIREIPDATQAGSLLLKKGVQMAVITLGSRGAVLVTENGNFLAIPPTVKRFSSVGSGDAFLAGLMTALIKGVHPSEALRYATAAGAANTQTLGGGNLRLDDYFAALERVVIEKLF